jgi:tetratricopeptide (TPR) repeat protein
LAQFLLGFYATSAFLHFYFDGFIWRKPSATSEAGRNWASLAKPGLFAIPLTVFMVMPPAVDALSTQQAELLSRVAPHFAFGRQTLGSMQRASGHFAEAAENLQAAIALNPYQVEAHFELALSYAGTQQFAAAKSELLTVLEQQPDHLGALMALSQMP